MARNAVILAGGQCKWGVREAHLVDLFQEAAKACFNDIPTLKPKDVDGLIVASSYAGRCSFQVNTAPVIAERVGVKPTSICTRCDTLCAGGSTGIILATGLVQAGAADIVMVAGGEKLYTPQKWEVFYSELASVDHDWDGVHGMGLPPPFFALTAQEHMMHYGSTKEQLAAVSVANYNYAATNPVAQMQKNLTLEEAMNAPVVVPPLTLYDCCPITDGAAVCIITTDEIARKFTDRPLVYIRGTAQVCLNSVSANFPGAHLADWMHTKMAGEKAYARAKVGPGDIKVAQTHDCFSISEVIEVEELGFCKKGEGGDFCGSKQIEIGGKVPVNTDGGLLACGHPFGATGIRQGIEVMKQLQGRARHQVKDADIALTHNLSGANAEHTILIYGREPVK
ncbi:MAG: 3-ketoacyl-CoA thiolase [Syntrophorhabdus sp. PtaU1.Bin058]|nr:MAG: 3-ketoacyl-CoA thiolase [Syntrophorhabdus sp. PtaU1.Bin058]